MNVFKYRYCKARMVAFINNELPLAARRRVARYIDECPKCYNEYTRQRALQHKLTDTLPTFGQPQGDQLDRIWMAVQGELNTPPRPRPAFQMRYGLVTMALVMGLMLPLLMGNSNITQAAVTPPTPTEQTISAATTEAPQVAQAATLDTTRDVHTMTIRPEAVPQGTPEAGK